MLDSSVIQDIFILGMCFGAACFLAVTLLVRCFNWLVNSALDRAMKRRGIPLGDLTC